MRARGLEPSATTFGTLIGIASDAADAAHVREAWAELQRSGLPVHVSAANAYLAALLREVGGWRLAAGGWRLASGGWRLASGGWRLAAGGWRLGGGLECIWACGAAW
jgi:hypothetical protein